MFSGGAPQGRDGPPRRRLHLAALVVLSVAACTTPRDAPASRPYRRSKSAQQVRDSGEIARLAIARLTDTTRRLALRVDQFTHGSNGYLVRLLPKGDGTAGGGTVWVDEDGSATVIKRY